MKKLTLNFLIDALMYISISTIIGIGFLIKYILIPGQERWVKYESNIELYLFGLDRHEWGVIHLIIGLFFFGLVVLHIILHWSAIVNIYNKIFKVKTIRAIFAILLFVISGILIFIPFFLTPELGEIEKGHGRQNPIHNNTSKEDNDTLSRHKENLLDNNSNPEIEVKGFMTLSEVSSKYSIPTEIIKMKLNLPNSTSDSQKIGWLRNKYNFTMSDIEEIIKEFNKK